MSSDYEFSDSDGDYYVDDEEMIDGTQGRVPPRFIEFLTDILLPESGQSEDDMDMDAFGDDFKVIPKGKRKSYEIDYESLSQSAIEKLMQSDVEHICGIFGVDVSPLVHSLDL